MLNPHDLFIMKINELRDAANRTNPYNTLRISALLRQLLVDGTPLTHVANREPRLQIRFVVNDDHARTHTVTVTGSDTPKTAQYRPLFPREGGGQKAIKLADFLALPCGEIDGKPISVRELIKYVANDAGGVHASHQDWTEHGSKCAQFISTFRSKQTPIASHLLSEIALVVLSSLKELYDALLPFPSLPCHQYMQFSNPAAGAQAVLPGWTVFEPQHWLESKNLNFDLSLGFELHMVVRTPNLRAGIANGLLYEARSARGPMIQLIHTGERRIARYIINDDVILAAHVPDQAKHHSGFHSFSFRVRTEGEMTYCSAVVDGRVFPGSGTLESSRRKPIVYQSIGANQDGERGAEFHLRELCLTEPLDDAQYASLQQYFWKKLWPNN